MAGTAAKKAKKATKAKKPTKAKKLAKGRRGGIPEGHNYLVRDADGKLLVASGKTGKVGGLRKKDQVEIEKLIQERQALGLKLSQLLDEQGYVVAVSHPTNIIAPKDGDQ